MRKNKGITLIALIIIIMVILILAGVVIAIFVGNNSILNGAGNIERKPITAIDNCVGKYADLDGDGTIEGIIYADLLAQQPVGDGNYTLPPAEEEASYKTYEISRTNQIPKNPWDNTKNLFDATERDVVVLAPKIQIGKNKRFYVMELEDRKDICYWGTACLKKEIRSWNITSIWRLPTKDEWSMFCEAFSISQTNKGINFGLNGAYWTSTENNPNSVWIASFWNERYSNEGVGYTKKWDMCKVRLCTTF